VGNGRELLEARPRSFWLGSLKISLKGDDAQILKACQGGLYRSNVMDAKREEQSIEGNQDPWNDWKGEESGILATGSRK